MANDQGCNPYRVVPGGSTTERVVYDIQDEPFFAQYIRMRAQHNKHQRSQKMHWERHPYCKLQLIEALLRKCRDTTWFQKHWWEVFTMYLYIIFDQRLLFAQTREKTGVKRPDAWRNTKAGAEAAGIVELVHAEAITYHYYCLNHIKTDTGRLNYQDIFQEQSDRLMEHWQRNTVCNSDRLWSREEYLYIIQHLREDYQKVSTGSRTKLLIPNSDQKEREETKVLGMTVQEYYETRFRADGTITLAQWRAFVDQQLPRLQRYIVSLEQHKKRLIQKAYKPFLLESQWMEYCRQQRQTQNMIDIWNAAWKLPGKSHTDQATFWENIPLPQSLKCNAKAERYFQEIKHIGLSECNSDSVALLFLLRTQYKALMKVLTEREKCRWGKNCWQRDKLSPENLARLNPGYYLLRKMVVHSKNCLQYTAQDGLALSVPIVTWDTVEMWYGVLKTDLQKTVQARGRENQLLLDQYREKFYRASTDNKEVGEWLIQVIQQYDWSGIPWQEYAEKNEVFGVQYRSIGNYRLNWMKCCLLERTWIDQLVEQGYENLNSLAQMLFAKFVGKS